MLCVGTCAPPCVLQAIPPVLDHVEQLIATDSDRLSAHGDDRNFTNFSYMMSINLARIVQRMQDGSQLSQRVRRDRHATQAGLRGQPCLSCSRAARQQLVHDAYDSSRVARQEAA